MGARRGHSAESQFFNGKLAHVSFFSVVHWRVYLPEGLPPFAFLKPHHIASDRAVPEHNQISQRRGKTFQDHVHALVAWGSLPASCPLLREVPDVLHADAVRQRVQFISEFPDMLVKFIAKLLSSAPARISNLHWSTCLFGRPNIARHGCHPHALPRHPTGTQTWCPRDFWSWRRARRQDDYSKFVDTTQCGRPHTRTLGKETHRCSAPQHILGGARRRAIINSSLVRWNHILI